MRVLIVTRNMPPLVGGMERLNWHMAEELAVRASVRLIGPVGSAALAPAGVQVQEVPAQRLPLFLVVAWWYACHEAWAWRPNIVLAGSGLVAPLVWFAAKLCRAKTVVYTHGLDIAVRNRLYQWVWIPAIRCMDTVIANSEPTQALAVQAGVKRSRITVVSPGVELPPDTSFSSLALREFRQKYQIGEGRPILLSVGRLTERKGLREFVSEVLPKVVKEFPDVLLVIIGDTPSDSLYAKPQTPASIQAAADAVGVGGNILFLGVINEYKKLAAAYLSSNIHVFPVRTIPYDPEGFGMVALEAAAHGVPTVAYATGGVVDAVAPEQSGVLIEPDNVNGFADAIIELLHTPMQPRMIRAFAKSRTWEHFGAALWAATGVSAESRHG